MTINCWMCRHPNVSQSKDRILIDSIVKEKLTLECPICYDTFDLDNLFFNGHPPAGGRLLNLHLCLCCQSWLFHMLFLFSCHIWFVIFRLYS